MELLNDSMKAANSVMVSDAKELAPPLSWCGICGAGGLAMGAHAVHHVHQVLPHPRECFHLDPLGRPYSLRR